MKQYNNEKYVVSFTTFGERIKFCEKMLTCLDNQSYKDFHLVLTLYKDDVKFIDATLQKRIDENKLELIVADVDLGPHLKYFYSMQKYADLPLITIDDDRYYKPDMIEKLVNCHEKNQNCVVANCAIKMRAYANQLTPIMYWNQRLERNQISHKAMAEGFCGILYPAHCFSNLNDEIENIKKCKYDDDIFLKALEIRHNIPVIATGNPLTTEDNNVQEMMKYNLHNNQNVDNTNRDNMCKLLQNELLAGFLL